MYSIVKAHCPERLYFLFLLSYFFLAFLSFTVRMGSACPAVGERTGGRSTVLDVEIIWRIPPYLYIRNIISWRYLHYYICRYPRITSRLSVYINPPDPHSNASAVYSHL